MNYTLLQILNILYNEEMTGEIKHESIINELSILKTLPYNIQEDFYNELNIYMTQNPLMSLALLIHYNFFQSTSTEAYLNHYINEYNNIRFQDYFLSDPLIGYYTQSYLSDWIFGINKTHFDYPRIKTDQSYILCNIIVEINKLTVNKKYNDFFYQISDNNGLFDYVLESGDLSKHIHSVLINLYAIPDQNIGLIIYELIGHILTGIPIPNYITTNLEFILNQMYLYPPLQFEVSSLQYDNISLYNAAEILLIYLLSEVIMSIINDYKYYLGMDPNILYWIGTYKYMHKN